MKNLSLLSPLVLSIFLSAGIQFRALSAQAGGGGTGGGGTHVCFKKDEKKRILKDQDGNQTIDKIELYDLYEAREARRYTLIDEAGKTANQLLNEAMKKLFKKSPAYALTVASYLKYYSEHKNVVTDKEWEIIKDAKIIFIDKGCQYQQIAQWRDDYESIFIDGDIKDLFSKSQLNLAGLALHEAVYATERLAPVQDQTSDFSRKIVGQSFSKSIEPDIERSNLYYSRTLVGFGNDQQTLVSSLKNRVSVRIVLMNKDIPVEVDLKTASLKKNFPKFISVLNSIEKIKYFDFKESHCSLNSNSYYCDLTVERKEIARLSVVLQAMKRVPVAFGKEDPNAGLSPEVQVEIFENGQQIRSSRLKLNYSSNINFGMTEQERQSFEKNGYSYTTSTEELIVPPFEESIEPEVLNLDIQLLNKNESKSAN